MHGSLLHLFSDATRRFAGRAAISAGESRWSYAELDRLVRRAAGALAELGVEGERIGLLLPNHTAFPVMLYGVLHAGGRVVMMNPQYSPREAREVLADAGVSTVITVTPLLPLLPDTVRAVLLDDLPAYLRVIRAGEERLLALDAAQEEPVSQPAADEEAVVVYTAANHGRARGARLSHRNLVANAASTVEAMALGSGDRVLAALPLIHLFGLTVTLNGALAAGATVIPVERFNPVRLLELLEQERATVITGVPGIYMALLSAAERRGVPEHALRIAIVGGSPLPLEIGRRWEEVFGLPLREGYGLTEAGPVCLFNRADHPNRPGTLGFPFPDVEVTVRDHAGSVLPDGEVGEICVAGENVFLGYIGDRGRDPRDFHGDALRTGDLGSVEQDGVVRFRGMLKPMFTRNGFNVYPRELERVLSEDPRIERVRVCALPDPVKENEIVLYIEPAADTTLSEDDVRQLCQQRLAAFKQPGRIHIGDETTAG